MTFLRRMIGGEKTPAWPQPGPISDWPANTASFKGKLDAIMFDPVPKMVDVVGEGSYQGSLERVGGGRTVDGARIRDHVALLLPEPSNPYDPNAVRVLLTGSQSDSAMIGYLSRENAVAYRPVIDRLAAQGQGAA